MKRSLTALAVAACIGAGVDGKVFFHESFDSMDQWVTSAKKSDYGKFELSSGDFSGDKAINQGLKTMQDAKFYASSTVLPEPVTNEGKDLVVSLSVKHEQGLDCGGGYIKLLTSDKPADFHGESEYFLMFGPDQCGYTKKVHVIFGYKGKNLLWKKEPRYPDDKLTHVYTLIVKPDNTYEMHIDGEKKESGDLEKDWDFLPPKQIADPEDKKPEDWVDDAQMDDPEDKKPEDWDSVPEKITDPDAKKPEDWDDEEDGEWEAPEIPNPEYKGEWRPKRIPNPAYKGVWEAKKIDNPEYTPDEKLYAIRNAVKSVGIDVWQVKSGSIFDNIIIGDDVEEVNAIIDKTWKATKDAEKAALDAKEKAQKADDEKKDAEAEADAGADDEDEEL